MSVGSSAPKGAVFLSYASQDAEAAKRICDALRAAGVEVWFDQNELVGGDAWDQKIRKQIKECALFVPVISASTQARREGYFRLEWKLAAQRTHTMADGTPFLLPVVIDQTRDDQALVPEEFRAVQWTRLPGGETSPAFMARVKKLLNEEPAAEDGHPPTGKSIPATNRRRFSRLWWVAPIFGVAMALLLVLRDREKPATSAAVAPESAARQLTKKAQALFEDPNVTRDDMQLAEDFCKQAVQLAPDDGEVWAVYSELNSLFFRGGLDRSPERMEQARTQAERAIKLAPTSNEAKFARASYLRGLDGPSLAEAEGLLRELSVATPNDHRVWISLGKVVWGALGATPNLARADEALKIFERAAAIPAGRAEALGQSGWLKLNLSRWPEAEADLDAAIVLQPRASLPNSLKALLATFRGDLPAARAAYERLSDAAQRSEGGVAAFAELSLRERQPAKALDLLAGVTRDYLAGPGFTGTTDGLRGFAYQMLGKTTAAQNAWQAALKVVDQRLAGNPRERHLLCERAQLLALLGQREAAMAALNLFEEVHPPSPTGLFRYQSIPVHALMAPPDRVADLVLERCRGMPTGGIRTDYRFDPIKDHPRFQAALAGEFVGGPLATPGTAATDKSIAVLPFTNLSDDKDSGYFADGVHEDVLTNLAGIRELRVVSRTSVMDYRGTTKKIPQIGRELNVAYVLEGSIRRAGNQVRVTGQLIRTATDQHVWAKSFDRDLTDIFAIQAELAKAIAAELNAALSPSEQKELTERPTENLAAYDLFLRSREIANRGAASTRDELQARERLLQSAVELDPKFVEAWCELVQAHVGLIAASVDTTPARLAKATSALDRARALAPDAPEVERAAGAYDLFGLRDLPRARARFARLVDQLPNDVDNLNWLSTAQQVGGQWPDLLSTQRRLTKLDPANRIFSLNLIFSLQWVRRYDEAMAECRRLTALRQDDLGGLRQIAFTEFYATGSTRLFEETIQRLAATKPDAPEVTFYRKARALNSGNYQEYLRLDKAQPAGVFRGSYDSTVLATLEAAAVYRLLGDDEGARTRLGNLPATLKAQVELEPNNTQYLRSLAVAESILGHHAEALRCIERAAAVLPESKDARIGTSVSSLRARILAWAGDKDRAIAEIARLLQVPSQLNVHAMKTDRSWWAPLEDDPRFQALLRDPRNNAPLY